MTTGKRGKTVGLLLMSFVSAGGRYSAPLFWSPVYYFHAIVTPF